MAKFATIRQTAKSENVSENLLRRMVAAGTCPGFLSGNRFIVNVDLLMEKLDAISLENSQGKREVI